MRITLTIEGAKKTVSLIPETENEKQMLKIYFNETDKCLINSETTYKNGQYVCNKVDLTFTPHTDQQNKD